MRPLLRDWLTKCHSRLGLAKYSANFFIIVVHFLFIPYFLCSSLWTSFMLPCEKVLGIKNQLSVSPSLLNVFSNCSPRMKCLHRIYRGVLSVGVCDCDCVWICVICVWVLCEKSCIATKVPMDVWWRPPLGAHFVGRRACVCVRAVAVTLGWWLLGVMIWHTQDTHMHGQLCRNRLHIFHGYCYEVIMMMDSPGQWGGECCSSWRHIFSEEDAVYTGSKFTPNVFSSQWSDLDMCGLQSLRSFDGFPTKCEKNPLCFGRCEQQQWSVKYIKINKLVRCLCFNYRRRQILLLFLIIGCNESLGLENNIFWIIIWYFIRFSGVFVLLLRVRLAWTAQNMQ